MEDKKLRLKRRKNKIKARIIGTSKRPRLSVYRGLKHIYAQLIDDDKGETLVAVSDLEVSAKGKTNLALEVGRLIGKKAKEKGISQVVFDRGGRKYHGRVKALAEGARESGLEF